MDRIETILHAMIRECPGTDVDYMKPWAEEILRKYTAAGCQVTTDLKYEVDGLVKDFYSGIYNGHARRFPDGFGLWMKTLAYLVRWPEER